MQIIYLIIITITILFFFFVGIRLLIIANIFKIGLDEACSGGSSTIAEAFNELYSTSDDIYCVSNSTGCLCEIFDHTINPSSPRRDYNTTISGGISNVQGCTFELERAFASYGVTFDSLGDIVEYLDFFGEIEKEYKCSGMCTKQGVYYFDNIAAGEPQNECIEKIKSELIEGVIKSCGIAFVAIGNLMTIIWFIQFGLWCRNNQKKLIIQPDPETSDMGIIAEENCNS